MEAALSQAGSEPRFFHIFFGRMIYFNLFFSHGQRPDPSGRLGPAAGQARGLAAKLSPRLGELYFGVKYANMCSES